MSSPQTPVAKHSDRSPRRGNAVAVVALILSLVAVGLAAWAAFRPTSTTAEHTEFTSTQQADAKTAICTASDVVRRGVSMNTNLQSPGGAGDITGSLAVAANARLSLSDGGQYLLARLDPATPAELSTAVTKFADTLMDIGATATAGALNTDPDQAARLRDADSANTRIAELCK